MVEDAVMFSVLLERFEGLEEHIEDLRDNPKAIKKISAFVRCHLFSHS